jgi:hypothetical protein
LTIERLDKGDYATVEASFSEKLRAALPERKLRSTWESVAKKNGRVQKMREPVSRITQKLRAVAIGTEFDKGRLEIEIVFNQSDQIAGILFHKLR